MVETRLAAAEARMERLEQLLDRVIKAVEAAQESHSGAPKCVVQVGVLMPAFQYARTRSRVVGFPEP